MATANYAITALTDIPPLVASFAATAGWTVTGTASAPILTHPSLGGAVPMTLTTAIAAGLEELTFGDGSGHIASARSPQRGLSSTATVVQPTQVYLFGGMLPQPYINITIEYGYNLFRHLYFGYPEKVGNYTGGEIITGSKYGDFDNYAISYVYEICAYPFSARNETFGSGNGYMNINHGDNPTQWRAFRRTGDADQDIVATAVVGGFGDSYNDAMLARALSPYAGANILTPINLFAPMTGGGFVPIGRPAGALLVHMRDIEPASQINDGIKTWRCFPAFRKSGSTSVARTGPNQWPLDETSYYVGYAYLED